MKPNRIRTRRAAFFSMVAITAGLVLLLFAVLLNRLAFLGLNRERIATMESQADQIVQSARAWSFSHEFSPDQAETVLSVDEILSAGTTAHVQLRLQTAQQPPTIECDITVTRGSSRLTRRAVWPLPLQEPAAPAAPPATP